MKYLTISCLFFSLFLSNAFAAGQMQDIRQEIDVEGATITTTPGSNGGGASGKFFGIGSAGFEKTTGQIDIGIIKNSGGNMTGVSQTIKAKGAEINSNGAPISIGEISNSN